MLLPRPPPAPPSRRQFASDEFMESEQDIGQEQKAYEHECNATGENRIMSQNVTEGNNFMYHNSGIKESSYSYYNPLLANDLFTSRSNKPSTEEIMKILQRTHPPATVTTSPSSSSTATAAAASSGEATESAEPKGESIFSKFNFKSIGLALFLSSPEEDNEEEQRNEHNKENEEKEKQKEKKKIPERQKQLQTRQTKVKNVIVSGGKDYRSRKENKPEVEKTRRTTLTKQFNVQDAKKEQPTSLVKTLTPKRNNTNVANNNIGEDSKFSKRTSISHVNIDNNVKKQEKVTEKKSASRKSLSSSSLLLYSSSSSIVKINSKRRMSEMKAPNLTASNDTAIVGKKHKESVKSVLVEDKSSNITVRSINNISNSKRGSKRSSSSSSSSSSLSSLSSITSSSGSSNNNSGLNISTTHLTDDKGVASQHVTQKCNSSHKNHQHHHKNRHKRKESSSTEPQTNLLKHKMALPQLSSSSSSLSTSTSSLSTSSLSSSSLSSLSRSSSLSLSSSLSSTSELSQSNEDKGKGHKGNKHKEQHKHKHKHKHKGHKKHKHSNNNSSNCNSSSSSSNSNNDNSGSRRRSKHGSKSSTKAINSTGNTSLGSAAGNNNNNNNNNRNTNSVANASLTNVAATSALSAVNANNNSALVNPPVLSFRDRVHKGVAPPPRRRVVRKRNASEPRPRTNVTGPVDTFRVGQRVRPNALARRNLGLASGNNNNNNLFGSNDTDGKDGVSSLSLLPERLRRRYFHVLLHVAHFWQRMMKIVQNNRTKHELECAKIPRAAFVIQCAWRRYGQRRRLGQYNAWGFLCPWIRLQHQRRKRALEHSARTLQNACRSAQARSWVHFLFMHKHRLTGLHVIARKVHVWEDQKLLRQMRYQRDERNLLITNWQQKSNALLREERTSWLGIVNDFYNIKRTELKRANETRYNKFEEHATITVTCNDCITSRTFVLPSFYQASKMWSADSPLEMIQALLSTESGEYLTCDKQHKSKTKTICNNQELENKCESLWEHENRNLNEHVSITTLNTAESLRYAFCELLIQAESIERKQLTHQLLTEHNTFCAPVLLASKAIRFAQTAQVPILFAPLLLSFHSNFFLHRAAKLFNDEEAERNDIIHEYEALPLCNLHRPALLARAEERRLRLIHTCANNLLLFRQQQHESEQEQQQQSYEKKTKENTEKETNDEWEYRYVEVIEAPQREIRQEMSIDEQIIETAPERQDKKAENEKNNHVVSIEAPTRREKYKSHNKRSQRPPSPPPRRRWAELTLPPLISNTVWGSNPESLQHSNKNNNTTNNNIDNNSSININAKNTSDVVVPAASKVMANISMPGVLLEAELSDEFSFTSTSLKHKEEEDEEVKEEYSNDVANNKAMHKAHSPLHLSSSNTIVNNSDSSYNITANKKERKQKAANKIVNNLNIMSTFSLLPSVQKSTNQLFAASVEEQGNV